MSNPSVAFDRAADYYDRTRGFPPGVEQDVASLIARAGGLNPSSRVLEIGIGTGRIALPVASHVRAYYGIDLARPMLDKLRAKQTTEAVNPVHGDATRLPFAAATFDAVIAVHVFHLIPGWRDVLAEVVRVLRPGAPLLHGWNGRLLIDDLQKVWNDATHEIREVQGAVPHDWRELFLSDNGWRELGAVAEQRFSIQRTPQDFYHSMEQRYFSGTWRMTDEQMERGLSAVRAYIAAHYPDPTQPLTLEGGFSVQAYLPPAGA
ncbi:MAG: class I SAM-dependent methyltransferase [Chloroflexota bacterium]